MVVAWEIRVIAMDTLWPDDVGYDNDRRSDGVDDNDGHNCNSACHVGDKKSYDEDNSCRFEDTSYCRELLAELNGQRHTKDFLDLVVKVQDMEFPCHRAVLASTPYFKAMLSSNLSEGNSKVVPLYGVDSDGFSKILDFLYTGEISITQDDVHDILQAAHMFQIDKITEYCETFIVEDFDMSNCLDVMRVSDLYGFSKLREKTREVALSNFSEICQNEEFLTLSGDELLDLLTDEKLRVTDEEEVVAAVIRWLDQDPENCRAVIVAILQEIRLMSVRVSTLKKLELHPVIQDSPECLAIVKTAMKKHFSTTQAVADEWKLRRRRGTSDDLAVLVGGWRIDDDETRLNIRGLGTPSYHVTNLPTPVTGYMSVTSAERCLYVTGGRAHPLIGEQGPHSAPSRQAFRYDFLTDTWTALPDMPRGRAGHQSAIVDEKLFLVKGDTDDTSELSMDCYDLEVEAWMKPPTLPELDPSSDLTVTACGSKLVFVELLNNIKEEGSYRWFRPELRIHGFDVKTAHWLYDHTFPSCSSERLYQLVTAVHEKVHILLVGGSSVNREIVVYDVEKGTLFETEENEGLTFCGTRYVDMHVDEDNSMVQREDVIYSNFDANNQSTPGFKWDRASTLPFTMIGQSILATKKSTIGWYCRDLDKVEHDEEDETTSLGRAVTCIPID
ncbi:kelch-like protein 24 [Branchiostoma floridae]|uniref:Kelch-like protein 24 n=1 Tax=Branchiostoma floridae TaxID=7739 RepID=A0A9J7LN81_BRAFL|nr:kelch-like protein 24 [Branchiostoma floridae]